MRDTLARVEKQLQQDAGMDALAAEKLGKANQELRKAQNDAGESQAEVSGALHARGLPYASPEKS